MYYKQFMGLCYLLDSRAEMKRSEIRFPAKCKVRTAVAKSNMHSIQSVSKGSDGAGVDFREDLVLKLCPQLTFFRKDLSTPDIC